MNYRLAHNVELVERDGKYFLMSKAPLCVLRLNRSLADLVSRGKDGVLIHPLESEIRILEQLVAKGFVERWRNPSPQSAAVPFVSIVIPVKDRADELSRCLSTLDMLEYPQEKLQVIVVDDGSSDNSPAVARESGALLVSSGGVGRGPAAARNVGAALAKGEILAFIDSDCTASSRWLNELIHAFDDPAMAAVGGQVDGMCTESAVDRYESVMSSLSIGSRERIGNSGNDTFYLPSCNLLVRRSAFMDADGFRDEMHVGEDVDLTWRLRDKGWSISYLPAGNICHEHRSSLRSFMSRRFDYGTSEGMLKVLHPERKKLMVIPLLLAMILMLCLAAPLLGGWPLLLSAAVLTIDAVTVRLRFIKRKIPIALWPLVAGRLRALGSLAYYLSYHLIRYYALLLLVVALIAPGLQGWAFLCAVLVCASGVDYAIKKPPLSFIRFCGIYCMEQIAYGAGVFWGCVRRRCFSSYHVVIVRQMEQTA